jgi:hypothetical protein
MTSSERLMVDPAETVLIVESERDVHAAAELGFPAVCIPDGVSNWHEEHGKRLAGRTVVILAKYDEAGRDQVGMALTEKAAATWVAELPDSKELSEWVQLGGTAERLRDLLKGAREWRPLEKPVIDGMANETSQSQVIVSMDEAMTAREAIARLGGGIYQRAGQLVHIVEDATPCRSVDVAVGSLRIRALAAPALRERIAENVNLVRESNDKLERVRPPGWLVSAILHRGEWPADHIPPLSGIIRSPMLRPDYSVIQTPGFDRATGLYYKPDGEFPAVPDAPTLANAREAAGALLEAVCDFPFLESDEEDHRSAWLAYVLTLAGRPAIPGPCPLFVFDAPAAGSGKSLLVDVANLIVFGSVAARYSWNGDNAELRKTITTVAIEALPAVLLDNLDSEIRSPALDACLTGTTWRDRVLGKSESTGTLPLTTVWSATGNNVQLEGDTSRRALFVRLEPNVDDPEARTEFRHDNLLQWTRENRHRLAVAAVTILRAYAVDKLPQRKLASWGSFEGWTRLVRQAVTWLGFQDPALTRRLARNADRTRETLRLLLDGIQAADNGEGLTAAEIVRLAGDADVYPALAEGCRDLWSEARLPPFGQADAAIPRPSARGTKISICGWPQQHP